MPDIFPDPDEFPNFDNVDSNLIADTPDSYSVIDAKFNEEVADPDSES